jgi:hypothetical protein
MRPVKGINSADAGNNVSFSTLFAMRAQEGRGAADAIRRSSMPTWDVDAEPLPAQNFHPEIGYLCPTDQMRRKMRSAAMAVLAGMVITAGMAFALMGQLLPHPPADGVGEESVLSAMALPPSDKAARPAGESVPATLARAAAVTGQADPSRAEAACNDLSGSFLSPQCRLGKTGKSRKSRMTRMTRMTRAARAARAAGYQVATVPIGHADEAGPKRAAASGAASAADTAAAAVATNEAPTVVQPEKPAPAKRPVKTAHKQAPRRNFDAPAAAPFGLFHEPSRTGSGAWAMSW